MRHMSEVCHVICWLVCSHALHHYEMKCSSRNCAAARGMLRGRRSSHYDWLLCQPPCVWRTFAKMPNFSQLHHRWLTRRRVVSLSARTLPERQSWSRTSTRPLRKWSKFTNDYRPVAFWCSYAPSVRLSSFVKRWNRIMLVQEYSTTMTPITNMMCCARTN